MGEAAKRKAKLEAWRSSLSDDEKIVAQVAERLSAILPLFGACYQGSLFLKYHLEVAHGLKGQAIVGFVNDGTDDLYGSHAWYLFNRKKTDLAISRPLRPELQPAGPLTILDFELKPGWSYSYHLEEPPQAKAFVKELLERSDTRDQMAAELAIRAKMKDIADDLDSIRTYLDQADNGLTYEIMASRLAR